MDFFKVFSVVWVLAVVLASADDDVKTKRDKRTVDLVLKGFADVFGYDVVKRISGLPIKMVTPKPTFFPPPVAPLPPGSYSRIILTLGSPQQPSTPDQPTAAAPVAPVQQAGMIPVLLTHGSIMPLSAVVPVAQNQMMAPPSVPAMAPAPAAPASTAAPAKVPDAAKSPAAAPAVQAPAAAAAPAAGPVAAAAPAPAGQQPMVPGVLVEQGPTRWNLFAAPPRLSETIRRTLNFNLNWDKNVQPLEPVITGQIQTTAVQIPAPSVPQSQVQVPVATQQPQTSPATQAPPAPPPSKAAPETAPPSKAPQVENPKETNPSHSGLSDYDYSSDDSNDQSKNNRNTNSISGGNHDEPSQQFKQAIVNFWKTSPWNSNNEDSTRDERKSSYQDEPEQASRYEEYDIEPVEQIPVARPENNYRVRVNVPLPEENGYYEKEEFVKEETKSPRKVRKNVSSDYTVRQKNSPKKSTHRRKNAYDLKAERTRRAPATKIVPDDNEEKSSVVQPEVTGVLSNQLHGVYKREKTLPWPIPVLQPDEFEVKNYYKKWRRTRNSHDQYYRPESYNTDFSYTVPEQKINYDAILKADNNYDHEFPKSAKVYSKQSGKKETLVTSNKESKSI